MGKLVNVVLPGGKVVSVPEDIANKIKQGEVAHKESQDEGATRATSDINTLRSSGPLEGIKAAGEGFADAASFGAYGAVLGEFDEDYQRNAQIRAQERPGARLVGGVTAALLPTGIAGKAGQAIGGALPINALGKAVGGATTGGRLAEGAVYGVGGYLASSNVTGDPVSIEGVIESAGIGSILNYGIGKLADGILSKSKNQVAELAEQAKIDKTINFFDSTPESYNELVLAHKATIQTAKKAQKTYDKAIEKYAESYSEFIVKPENTRQAIKEIDTLEFGILSQLKHKSKSHETVIKIDPANTLRAVKTTPEELSSLARAKEILAEAKANASKAVSVGDQADALAHLQKGIERAKPFIPEAKFPDIPSLSPEFAIPRPAVSDVTRLPTTVKQFANLDPKTIAKLSEEAIPGSPLAQAIEKFTADIGMTGGATAAETIAGVHSGLRDVLKATSAEIGRDGKQLPSILDVIRINSKRAVRYGLGRSADQAAGGGFFGASARTMTGAAVGYGLDGVEGAIIGAHLLSGKANVRKRVGDVFAKYGTKTSKVLNTAAPVTSFLATSFPSGEPDKETDIRKQALNRVDDLRAVMQLVNDASFTALKPLMNAPEDVAYKMHAQLTNAVSYLAQTVPVDPGMATNMFNSYWKPTHSEALKMAHVMEAVLSPTQAIDRLIAGQGHPAAADALWTVWPAHMGEAASALAETFTTHVQEMGKLTREQTSSLSQLFRIPLNGFQQPEVIMQLQSYFLPQASASGQSVPPSKAPTGGAPGRPASISNQPNSSQSRVQQLQR